MKKHRVLALTLKNTEKKIVKRCFTRGKREGERKSAKYLCYANGESNGFVFGI